MAPTDDDNVADQTAAWFARLTSGSATDADRDDFQIWLAASPSHRSAYATLNSILSVAEGEFTNEFASDQLLDMSDLQTEQCAPAENRNRWLPRTAMASAAAVCLMIGSFTTWQLLKNEERSYQMVITQVGQRETVKLADGSSILLNTASNLRYRLDEEKRSIFLDKGEAYFEVAKDRNRPFVVTLPTATVTAVGTAFNIRIVGTATEVAVTEGIVTFDHLKGAGNARYRLAVGDVALLNGTTLNVRRSVQTLVSTAWTQGQLVYQNRTLKEVVEDLDRYFPGRLVLNGGPSDSLRVSAVVNLTTEDDVLRSLVSQLPISVTTLPNGDRRISSREASARH